MFFLMNNGAGTQDIQIPCNVGNTTQKLTGVWLLMIAKILCNALKN